MLFITHLDKAALRLLELPHVHLCHGTAVQEHRRRLPSVVERPSEAGTQGFALLRVFVSKRIRGTPQSCVRSRRLQVMKLHLACPSYYRTYNYYNFEALLLEPNIVFITKSLKWTQILGGRDSTKPSPHISTPFQDDSSVRCEKSRQNHP